jgi:chemotaxis protein MotB
MTRKKIVYIERPINVSMYQLAALFLFLLTFFVVLSSISVMDGKRQKLAFGSIMGGFGILPGGRSPIGSEALKNILPPGPPLKKGEIDIRKIDSTLAQTGSLSGIGVSQERLGVTITIKSGIIFDGQTDSLSQDSRPVLEAIAKILSQVDNPVVITGHTDSIPIEAPPFNSNWGLSAARALAVLSYLESKGIKAGRLAAYGMGANRPITTNKTEAGRRLNRRVEITIMGSLPGNVDFKRLEQPGRMQDHTIFYKGYNLDLEEQ